MIVTVTMNPAIDKTVEIEKLFPGGLNRIKKVEYDAGGKGINVSKTIRELGGESIATGFLGGNTGKAIASVLEQKGIRHDFVYVEGETRTNTKVFEECGTVTELNEPGPTISKEQIAELMGKLSGYAKPGTLFVLSGSTPGDVDKQIYARIIRLVHERGAEVLLDADGELFRNALLEGPDMIKPNRDELKEYAGCDITASKEELLKQIRDLKEKGTKTVVLSMGKEGALFAYDGYEVRCPALKVKAHSTVGAGDAMVAAMAYAFDKKLSREKTVRLCMAASAGAVTTVGTKPPCLELVEKLMHQVIIEQIDS